MPVFVREGAIIRSRSAMRRLRSLTVESRSTRTGRARRTARMCRTFSSGRGMRPGLFRPSSTGRTHVPRGRPVAGLSKKPCLFARWAGQDARDPVPWIRRTACWSGWPWATS